MPEVAVLSFFLSAAPVLAQDASLPAGSMPQIRVPLWILGARMLFMGLDGTGRTNTMLHHDVNAALASDLQPIVMGGSTFTTSASRPFLAFMSETQGFLGSPEDQFGAEVRAARRDQAAAQRTVDGGTWWAFQYQASRLSQRVVP